MNRFLDPGSHYALDERNADSKPIHDEGTIVKVRNGYERIYLSHTCVYDKNGKYTGQWQPDMLSEEPGALDLWLSTFPGDKCYHELTKEEMEHSQ